jgi:hypothetical protein
MWPQPLRCHSRDQAALRDLLNEWWTSMGVE